MTISLKKFSIFSNTSYFDHKRGSRYSRVFSPGISHLSYFFNLSQLKYMKNKAIVYQHNFFRCLTRTTAAKS